MKRTAARNYLVSATSALMFAASIAIPTVASAASFSDIEGNAHETAITHVVEKGLISGYPDGTYKPNQGLTNSDVVKIMGRYLIENGYHIPKDYKLNSRFTDLSSSADDTLLRFAALLKDEGIFLGEEGQLKPTELITRQEMAVVLVNTLSKVHDFDFTTYVKGQTFQVEVLDLEAASETAQTAIGVLDYYDLTNVSQFNPTSTLTRGQFATFLYQSTFVKAPNLAEQPIEKKEFDKYKVVGDEVLYIDIRSTAPPVQGELAIDLFGVIGDSEVEIPNDNSQAYSITTNSSYLTVNGTRVMAKAEAIRKAHILDDPNDRFKVEIVLTMHETGEKIPYKFMLAREDEDEKNIKFNLFDRQSAHPKSLKAITIDVTDAAENILGADDLFKELLKEGYFAIEDPYGYDPKDFNVNTGTVTFRDGTKDSIQFTVSDINSKNVEGVITANGTDQTSIKLGKEGLTAGDSITLTLELGGRTQTVLVHFE